MDEYHSVLCYITGANTRDLIPLLKTNIVLEQCRGGLGKTSRKKPDIDERCSNEYGATQTSKRNHSSEFLPLFCVRRIRREVLPPPARSSMAIKKGYSSK